MSNYQRDPEGKTAKTPAKKTSESPQHLSMAHSWWDSRPAALESKWCPSVSVASTATDLFKLWKMINPWPSWMIYLSWWWTTHGSCWWVSSPWWFQWDFCGGKSSTTRALGWTNPPTRFVGWTNKLNHDDFPSVEVAKVYYGGVRRSPWF